MATADNKLEFARRMIGSRSWCPSLDGDSAIYAGPFTLKVCSLYWRPPWRACVKDINGELIAVSDGHQTIDEAQAVAMNLCADQLTMGNGLVLSPWTPEHGYCAMRYVAGTDPKNIGNRIAFIEKTPRVRVARLDQTDCLNWWQGPKGDSCGCDEDAEKVQAYGFYPPSREWCDEQLVVMGYILG